MERRCAAEAFDELRALGHTIKGASGAYGFEGLRVIGAREEACAKKRDTAGVQAGLSALASDLDRAVLRTGGPGGPASLPRCPQGNLARHASVQRSAPRARASFTISGQSRRTCASRWVGPGAGPEAAESPGRELASGVEGRNRTTSCQRASAGAPWGACQLRHTPFDPGHTARAPSACDAARGPHRGRDRPAGAGPLTRSEHALKGEMRLNRGKIWGQDTAGRSWGLPRRPGRTTREGWLSQGAAPPGPGHRVPLAERRRSETR